jgi:hypothetical protein
VSVSGTAIVIGSMRKSTVTQAPKTFSRKPKDERSIIIAI